MRGSDSWGRRAAVFVRCHCVVRWEGCSRGDYNLLCLWPLWITNSMAAFKCEHTHSNTHNRRTHIHQSRTCACPCFHVQQKAEWVNNFFLHHNKADPDNSNCLEEGGKKNTKGAGERGKKSYCLSASALTEINKWFKFIREQHHCIQLLQEVKEYSSRCHFRIQGDIKLSLLLCYPGYYLSFPLKYWFSNKYSP